MKFWLTFVGALFGNAITGNLSGALLGGLAAWSAFDCVEALEEVRRLEARLQDAGKKFRGVVTRRRK